MIALQLLRVPHEWHQNEKKKCFYMKFQKYERVRKEETNMVSRCFYYKANNYMFSNEKAIAQAELLKKKKKRREKKSRTAKFC